MIERYHIDYGNFIGAWSIDIEVCDDILKYYRESKNKFAGHVGHTNITNSTVNYQIKNSIDVLLKDKDLSQRYFAEIQLCLDDYKTQYQHSNFGNHGVIEEVHIQHYEPPEGGFHKWHFERNSTRPPVAYRHLVFMTYLNSVDDGGETEFLYQNLKIKPRAGLTLIWPADWTFTHKGNSSPSEHKYIITGWISLIPDFFS